MERWQKGLAQQEERERAVADANGSLRAEGLSASPAADAIMRRWVRGEISEAQMFDLVREYHGLG